jgi:hypothetical protein
MDAKNVVISAVCAPMEHALLQHLSRLDDPPKHLLEPSSLTEFDDYRYHMVRTKVPGCLARALLHHPLTTASLTPTPLRLLPGRISHISMAVVRVPIRRQLRTMRSARCNRAGQNYVRWPCGHDGARQWVPHDAPDQPGRHFSILPRRPASVRAQPRISALHPCWRPSQVSELASRAPPPCPAVSWGSKPPSRRLPKKASSQRFGQQTIRASWEGAIAGGSTTFPQGRRETWMQDP